MFKKKFKVVEGKSTLNIGLELDDILGEEKDVNISSKLLEFIFISLVFDIGFNDKNDSYIVDLIRFNPMLPIC